MLAAMSKGTLEISPDIPSLIHAFLHSRPQRRASSSSKEDGAEAGEDRIDVGEDLADENAPLRVTPTVIVTADKDSGSLVDEMALLWAQRLRDAAPYSSSESGATSPNPDARSRNASSGSIDGIVRIQIEEEDQQPGGVAPGGVGDSGGSVNAPVPTLVASLQASRMPQGTDDDNDVRLQRNALYQSVPVGNSGSEAALTATMYV